MDRNVERIGESDAHETAADWLQRLEHPQLKEEDIQSWLEWFGAADTHRKAFEEMQVLRRTFRELPEDLRQELKHRLATEPTANEGQARFGVPPKNRKNVFPRHIWALAASACAIALGLGTWWKIQTHVSQATYAAPVDHHRTVALEDGSSLVLGANSVVDVTYSRDLRTLDVQRGEAYFEVTKDAKRPFIVQAAGVRVTAIGTAFNVQRETDKVTVTVTEGRVAIEGGSKTDTASPAYLDVGQQAVLPLAAPKPITASKSVSKADRVISNWEKGRADFINAPLSEVLPVINRYAARKLVIDDPRVADLTYSGTIFSSHLDEWVASLPRVYAIRAVPLEDGTITLVSKSSEEKIVTTP